MRIAEYIVYSLALGLLIGGATLFTDALTRLLRICQGGVAGCARRWRSFRKVQTR